MCLKYDYEFVKHFIEEKEGELLTQKKKYKNSNSRIKIRCNKDGFIWETKFSKIVSGKWCRKCYINGKKLNIDVCKDIAKLKNGKCLSTEYISARTKMLWECEFGHQWLASLDTIRNHWCPYCSKTKKKTIEDCIKTAKEKGGECLSTEYIDIFERMLWRCGFGHEWWASYNTVLHHWCPYCSNNIKYTIEDCCKSAEERNGLCLSKEYKNNKIHLKWFCNICGNTWMAKYSSVINNNTWCPFCDACKAQKQLAPILKKIFNLEIFPNYRGFGWLKDKKRLEIDIWIPDIKLAIEYDGEQHFEISEHFGGVKKFKKLKKHDEIKNNLIPLHKDEINYFIRFNYKENITEEYVKEKLIQNDITISN